MYALKSHICKELYHQVGAKRDREQKECQKHGVTQEQNTSGYTPKTSLYKYPLILTQYDHWLIA